jgi:hypothetical protein
VAGAAIGPGAESVGVKIWAAAPGSARWGRALWGGGVWGSPDWRAVGCDVTEAVVKWGASQESGILSIAEATEIDLTTLDPNRELDPLNTASPYYGAVKPGTAVRVSGYAPGELVAGTGYIDEVSYDLASARGRIRAIGGISYLAQAQLPAGVVLPNTLRARVRAVVAAVGLGGIVPVQPEPSPTERAANGGFETGPAGFGSTSWDGWIASSPNGGTGIAVETGSGGEGARLCRLQGVAGVASTMAQRAYIRVAPGATYVLTVRGAVFAGSNAARVLVDARRDDGSAVTFGAMVLTFANGIPLTAQSTQYTVPADGSVTQLSLALTFQTQPAAATDVAKFDEVSLLGLEAGTEIEADPPVAPYDSSSARPAWQVITEAATDALVYVYTDPLGMLSFRSWGGFTDAPISLGCPPDDADPGDQWLRGLSTIDTTAAGDAVRNSIRAYSAGTTWQPAATDTASLALYGPRPFDVERVVPDFANWAARILADRADAGLDVAVGEVRPYTVAELAALLQTQLGGPSIVRVRDDAHGELVDLDVGLIGARVGVTPTGWRFGLATMLSRVDWDAITPEPPVPPIPPVGAWHVETRTYIGSSDALLALTSGGAKYGAGAAGSLPIGVWSGWTYRALLAFPAIPWTKIRALRTATLKLRTTTQVRVGFGGSPKTELRRITAAWSAGSASAPSSGNAVVWPGPSTTSSGAVTSSLPTSQNADKSIRCDDIVRAWAPPAVGGAGLAQYGIRLGEVSSSGSNTGEVWPVEQGGAARPTLELVLEVYD